MTVSNTVKIPSCCNSCDELKILKLIDNAIIPNKANHNDAGYDLYASEDITIPARSRSIVKTGIAMAIPNGYAGLVWPRSGLAVKNGLDVLAGVIDSGYRGEICVLLQNHADYDYNVNAGDRVAQILIQQIKFLSVASVESLNESDRGTGGFGSSGR